MKTPFVIYDIHLNEHTLNWGGKEWVVDGENGRWTYPGALDIVTVIDCYRKGVTESE